MPFRAIENGVPLVRAAASGLSAAIDPWGRVLGVSDFYASGDRTMTAQGAGGPHADAVRKTGDLFAWICVAAVVVALGFGAIESKRRSVHVLASEPVVAARKPLQLLLAARAPGGNSVISSAVRRTSRPP